MRPGRIHGILLRQLYLTRSNVVRIIPMFVWVGVDIVLWGFMTKYLNAFASSSSYNFVPAILGAVLLWDFLTRVLHGVSMAFMEDVWSRNLMNIFASPLSIGEYLAGLVLSGIGSSLLGLVAMIVLASAVFGLSLFAYGIMLLPFLMILFVTGVALGIFATAIMLRFGPASEWLIWPIPALLSPFAGVFYPLSTLPGWMQHVATLLPPSYVFEGIRAIVAGGRATDAAMAWGLLLSLVYVLLACLFFVYIYQKVVKNGLIARYSAESA